MEMIKFGMGNTLISFVDKYFEYNGDKEVKERGLTIGEYESAFLADLVVLYIFEKVRKIFMAQSTKAFTMMMV